MEGALTIDGSDSQASSSTSSSGGGGDVTISAETIRLADGGAIIAASLSDAQDAGESGRIELREADRIDLIDGGRISVETAQANAGDIALDAEFLLHLRDQSSITTSFAGGTGDGGNITIDPVFVVLDGASEIIAEAQQGSGGNINIRIVGGGALFKSPDSVIDASSDFGVDGVVEIDTPDTDISGSMVALPAGFFDTTSLLSNRCRARTAEDASSLIVDLYSLPLAPSASLPSYWSDKVGLPTAAYQSSRKEASFVFSSAQPLALLKRDCIP